MSLNEGPKNYYSNVFTMGKKDMIYGSSTPILPWNGSVVTSYVPLTPQEKSNWTSMRKFSEHARVISQMPEKPSQPSRKAIGIL